MKLKAVCVTIITEYQVCKYYNCMTSCKKIVFSLSFPFFFFFFLGGGGGGGWGGGGGGVRHISFANTFIIYSALLVLPGVSCSHNNM